MAKNEYKKLPGSGIKRRAFFDVVRTRVRLWQGTDHLLYQFSTGYTEDYKRFYYGDIQAITIRKTIRFMVLHIILLVLSAAFGFAAYYYRDIYVFHTASLFCLLFLIVNFLMGQTCVCHLYTQVSNEELYSLKRVRTAQKFLKIITPLIEEKQKVLSSVNSGSSTASSELKAD